MRTDDKEDDVCLLSFTTTKHHRLVEGTGSRRIIHTFSMTTWPVSVSPVPNLDNQWLKCLWMQPARQTMHDSLSRRDSISFSSNLKHARKMRTLNWSGDIQEGQRRATEPTEMNKRSKGSKMSGRPTVHTWARRIGSSAVLVSLKSTT